MIVPARVILAALDFLRREVIPETMPPALQALRCGLDSWGGNGLIERGMARLCLALLLSIVTSCAPAFDRGSKSPEDFEHDDAQVPPGEQYQDRRPVWRQPPHRLEWVRAVHGRQGLFETVTTRGPDFTTSMYEIA